jgi:CCR4-NOT transcription complex subunit 7/8
MPLPQMSRFQNGPNSISPYPHQFPSHAQGHASNHPQSLGNPSYLNPNAQLSPFAGNGALSLQGGLNAGGGFGVGAETGLASQAARMGFAHGAHLQQQQHHQQQQHVLGEHQTRNQAKGRIREVWKHNLNEEMAVIRDLVDKYPYIAMVRLNDQSSTQVE